MASVEDQIKKMYQAQIDSQKEQLKQDYMKADSDLMAQKAQNQKATDYNLNRTMVEAQKEAVNNAELRNAYGISSGAAAQAKLSESNQLRSDLTALRVQQQEADAEAERQRSLLANEYASAIRKAQADNDLAKAQALYEEAARQEELIAARQREQTQQKQNNDAIAREKQVQLLNEAKWIAAETGDYTLYNQLVEDMKNSVFGEVGESDNVKKFISSLNFANEEELNAAKREFGNTSALPSTHKNHVYGVLKNWTENGIPGGGTLTNADIAYIVQKYGLA